jgi:hypothetical protein
MVAIPALRTHAEDIIVARYEGHAWCDTTERELTCDIERQGRADITRR